LCVTEDQVLEAVKVRTYNRYSLMIENIQFCHKNSTIFIITQFDCTILLYNVYQVGKNKLLILNIFKIKCNLFTEGSTKNYFQSKTNNQIMLEFRK
jgi:hypothetical protein